MMTNGKYIVSLFIIALGSAMFLGWPGASQAACASNTTQLQIISRDTDGQLLPGVNYLLYQQRKNPDNQPYFGTKLASGKTDAGGQATVCVGTKNFPLGIKLYTLSAAYGYQVIWQDRFSASANGYAVEAAFGYFDVMFRDAQGRLLAKKPFQLFAQQYDADGQPVSPANQFITTYILGGQQTTGVTGRVRLHLAAGTYVFKIPADAGQYYHLYNQKLAAGQSKIINYQLGAIHLKIENALGEALPNFKFAVYAQGQDSTRQPILGLPLFKLATANENGVYDLYLPDGTYVIRGLNPATKTYYMHWSIKGRNQGASTVTWRLSGVRVNLLSADRLPLPNTAFKIGLTSADSQGNWTLAKPIINATTDANGRADILLTPGNYSLSYGNNQLHNLAVTGGQFVLIDWPHAYSIRPEGGEMALTTPLANSNVKITGLSATNVRGLSMRKQNVGTPYRITANTLSQPYTVVFFYNKEKLAARGINTDKLRIAFYNGRTKTWGLVGANNYSTGRLTASVRDTGIFTLIEIN
ncbi:MAG: hypothetical protein V1668_02645 [Patescibacteria group bacterium]